ncbi:MAG: LysE family translocator [Hyphomicrobiaceae bacterium]|nr:LysE family translocator [Hyphomicrobiaceae bacterium]
MTFDIILALVTFAFVSSITPGPNNMMLLASGVNFGFKRTVPHMLGVSLGHAAMVICIGLGLKTVFEAFPVAYTVLKVLGAGYMLWLAWKIANSGPVEQKKGEAKPFTFIQAALFQWVNPKAVIMAVTAISVYTVPENYIPSVFAVGIVFCCVNLPSVSTWAAFGTGLRRFLSDPVIVRRFNIVMALALVASLWPMLR